MRTGFVQPGFWERSSWPLKFVLLTRTYVGFLTIAINGKRTTSGKIYDYNE